jgi:polysaccharide biosynthesis transport protein
MDNDNFIGTQVAGVDRANPEEAINLRHYWHVALERRWLIITAFISVFILSLIYLFKATPIFQATARLQINPETDNILKIEGLAVGRQEQDYLQTQYKNLMSRSLLESVVLKLNLQDDERYAKRRDVIKAVALDLHITPVRLSRLVDISFEHPDGRRAALIANTIATNFVERNREEKINASLAVVDRLRDIVSNQKTNVESAERELQKYAEKHGKVSFEENVNIISQALKQIDADHTKARNEAISARQMAEQLNSYLTQGISIYTIPQVADNTDIQKLREELALVEATFAQLQQRYLPEHPDYMAAEKQVLSLKQSLTNQATDLVKAIRVKADMLEGTEGILKKEVADKELELLSLQAKRIQYNELKRIFEENNQLYKNVLAKTSETEITSRDKINNIVIRDPAYVPLSPVKPRILLTVFLGVVGGLGVALGLAFFVNYLDDSIKSQDDVETYLRLPFLGYVPNIKTNSVVERDLQSHLHPQSNAAEGFRTIRATISLTHKTEKFRVLAITSTIPSEGKSLVASNLAIVTAQTGLKTLLVDADLRRPSVHKAYQLHSPSGLSSYLTEETDGIESIAHKTEVPNLDVICCGSVPATPSELISSKRMMDFLQVVRTKYDRVILDCPPISAVSDPLVISAMSDGIVFVTKFNKIRREHARKSVQRIQNAGIHIIGAVLNDIDFEGKDSYYYSYYYYQNRYYASHYKTTPGDRKKEESPALAKSRNGH